jgi:hypothetical protein
MYSPQEVQLKTKKEPDPSNDADSIPPQDKLHFDKVHGREPISYGA